MLSHNFEMMILHKFITCDAEKCTGCRICELACSEVKENLYNPRKSRIRVVTLGLVINTALVCRFCEKPTCVRCCPRGALRQSEENGVVFVDEMKCDGCGWCLGACEFGALTFHVDKKTVIACDLCEGDLECIKACPFNALELVTSNILAQRARYAVTKSLFKGRS